DHRPSGVSDARSADTHCRDYTGQHKRLSIGAAKVRQFGHVEQLNQSRNSASSWMDYARTPALWLKLCKLQRASNARTHVKSAADGSGDDERGRRRAQQRFARSQRFTGGYRASFADWQRFLPPLNALRFIMIC